jgi:hypothetical protein
MRRYLIALITAVAACVLASPAVAANPIRITDPSGDAAGVPDVLGVTIEDAGTGFRFTIELGAMPDLAPDGVIGLFIDADRNAQTGATDVGGSEFLILADSEQLAIGRWDGTDFADFQNQPPNASLQNGRLAFTFAKSDLGSTKFNVVTLTASGSSENLDRAPDNAAFTYLPAITRLLIPAALTSVRVGSVLNARGVQAQMTPTPGQNVALRPTLRCTLTYRGRAIKALPGGCRWRIPAALRGKRLSLRITATVGSESRTQTVNVRVR